MYEIKLTLPDNFYYYYKEKSHSSEANTRSADKEMPRHLRNPNIYSRFRNIPPLQPILTQMNLVHSMTHYFLKMS
jgi:hypothetical protein